MTSSFIRSSIIIIWMWPAYGCTNHRQILQWNLWALFICMVAIQFYKLIFQGIIITFHRCIIVWITRLTYALLDSLRCTEINELLRCVLAALITMQQKLLAFRLLRLYSSLQGSNCQVTGDLFVSDACTTTLRSWRSIIVQLYRLLPLLRNKYVKSVHHLWLISSAVKFCCNRFGNTLWACPLQ